MVGKKSKRAKGKAKTLAARSLSRKHASDVKGGVLIPGNTKFTPVTLKRGITSD